MQIPIVMRYQHPSAFLSAGNLLSVLDAALNNNFTVVFVCKTLTALPAWQAVK